MSAKLERKKNCVGSTTTCWKCDLEIIITIHEVENNICKRFPYVDVTFGSRMAFTFYP